MTARPLLGPSCSSPCPLGPAPSCSYTPITDMGNRGSKAKKSWVTTSC